MPQKLNKAGKMQDYIPKGNGDASGEYGTSNGTNKNFTASDKKKETKANVINENKSVSVWDNEARKKEEYEYIKKQEEQKQADKPKALERLEALSQRAKEMREKEPKFNTSREVYNYYNDIEERLTDAKNNAYRYNDKEMIDKYKVEIENIGKAKKDAISKLENTKANIIDDDLSGKGNKEIKDIIDTYKIKDANGKTAEEYAKEIKVEVDKWEKDYNTTKQKSEKQFGKRTDKERLKDIARLRYENIDALNQEEDYNYIGEESGYLGYGSLDKLEKATMKKVATNNIAKKILAKK